MILRDLDDFEEINDNMIWKRAALEQLDQFKSLASRLNTSAMAVGSHTSKSISLPVVLLVIEGNRFLLRDNFHDINLYVKSPNPVELSLAEFFEGVREGLDWDWYLEQIDKCRGYSWREWTNEQIDDLELLQLSPDAPSYAVKSKDCKLRWSKRLESPEWWSKDWSSGALTYEGTFGPGVVLFAQRTPFAEGISDLIPFTTPTKYLPGCSEFMVSLSNIEAAETVIRRIVGSET